MAAWPPSIAFEGLEALEPTALEARLIALLSCEGAEGNRDDSPAGGAQPRVADSLHGLLRAALNRVEVLEEENRRLRARATPRASGLR